MRLCLKCKNRIEEFSAYKELVLLNQDIVYETPKKSKKKKKPPNIVESKPLIADPPLMQIKSEPIEESELVISAVTSIAEEYQPDQFIKGQLEHIEPMEEESEQYNPYPDQSVTGDPLDEADIEFVVADSAADDMDSSFTNHSETTYDPIADPFEVNETTSDKKSEENIDKSNRRHSSRKTNMGVKYFITKKEEKAIREAVLASRKEEKRIKREAAEARVAAAKAAKAAEEDEEEELEDEETSEEDESEDDDQESGQESESESEPEQEDPPEEVVKTAKGPPAPRLPKIPRHKGCVIRRIVLKQQEQEDRRQMQEYKFKYDQWSLKVDDFIRRFFPIINCKFCDQKFGTFTELRLHMHKTHPFQRKGWFVCCGRDYLTRSDLFSHIHYHISPTREPSCKTCLMVFETQRKCTQHNTDNHLTAGSTPLTCDFCPEVFSSRYALCKHFIIHLFQVYECPVCPGDEDGPVRFTSNKQLMEHITLYHKEEPLPFKCRVCQEKFTNRRLWLIHEAEVHGLHVGNLKCTHCTRIFNTFRGYMTHYLIHIAIKEGSPGLDCPDCDLTLRSLKELRTHEEHIHSTDKPFA